MRAGDVFRFNGIADIHVWMIISDPARDAMKVLIVSFSTWEPHLDQACIVERGEHPFVVQKSVVNYPRGRVVTDGQLEALKAAGRLRLLEPLSEGLLRRAREAAVASTRISLDMAEILFDQELVE